MTVNDRQEGALAEIVRISTAFAEACADCEHLRTTEAYPQAAWRAAWDRRLRLVSEWGSAAKRLTERETDPPELRSAR